MTLLTCPPCRTNLQHRVGVSPLLLPSGTGNGLLRTHKAPRFSMFLKTKPIVKDGVLSFNGTEALTGVPDNVVLTPHLESSAFLGANFTDTSSRYVFKIGDIKEARLLSLFRFKIWWMIPRVGNSASDIPIETQMLLLEASEESTFEEPNGNNIGYIVFLPFLDGETRSSLQGNSADELQVCVETGDPAVQVSESHKAVFVNYGNNPFDLINESMKILEKYCGTFTLRESKQMPGMLDWFGWCTWDAFYHDVNAEGIKEGLNSLSKGGTPARFLIIDDGWQDTINEFQKEDEPFVEGSQFGGRLVSIRENKKFRRILNEASDNVPTSLKEFVSDIKRTFGLKYVYVWHALMGYWGGLHPEAPETQKYNPTLKFPVQSPGNLAHIRDIAMDCMEKYGVGTIDPAKIYEFYDDLHSYLAKQGVDGVKVDVQNILETIATGSGGRVYLTKHFQQALENSISRNFQDNSIICCMGQNTDSVYNTKQSAITRASDDYYPRNPCTQTLHIAAVAYNSIFFGEVVVPDWDMFYSHHNAAEFHAIARAVGGCGVYVSDKPGHHDFNVLQRLVLPDGSVLRAKYPGRPTRDCLFCDPVTDGKSILKIWNVNKYTGVIGVFNCQGAGSWPGFENRVQIESPIMLSGKISPADIEYIEEVSGKPWLGDCAVFSFKTGNLFRLAKHEKFEVTLGTLQCDIFTVSPIKDYAETVKFAPFGLINMFNCGGAVDETDAFGDPWNLSIRIKGRGGGGIFGAYSNRKPKFCSMNMKEQAFDYRSQDHLLSIKIPTRMNSWDITLHY